MAKKHSEPSTRMRHALTQILVHGILIRREDGRYYCRDVKAPICSAATVKALVQDGYLHELKGSRYRITTKGRGAERALFAKYEGHAKDGKPPSMS